MKQVTPLSIVGTTLPMLTRFLKILLFASCIQFACAASAEPLPFAAPAIDSWSALTQPIFSHLTTENGLPHSTVTAMVQDKYGFLWVGTQGGLGRWDGYRFRNYLHAAADASSIPDDFIRCLKIDDRGRLWVGTNGGGLAWYDEASDSFHRIPVGKEGTSHVAVFTLESDGSGGLWAGTRSGLDHFPADGKTVEHLKHDDKDPATLPSDVISSLLRAKNGTLWVGTKLGLVTLVSGNRFRSHPIVFGGSSTPNVRRLYQDSKQGIWALGAIMGAAHFNGETGEAIPLPEFSSIQQSKFVAAVEAKSGHMYFAVTGGLLEFDLDKQASRLIQNDPSIPTSLASNNIFCLFVDRSGLLWVGHADGLDRFDAQAVAARTMFGSAIARMSTANTGVYSVRGMPDGSVWLGLLQDGIDIVDPERKRITRLGAGKSDSAPMLPAIEIFAISPPIGHSVFAATVQGLYAINPQTRMVRRVVAPERDPNVVVCAMQEDGNVLWLGGNDGLWRYDAASKDVHFVRAAGTEALKKLTILAIHRDKTGVLWLGTGYDGIFRFDPVKGTLQHFAFNETDPHSLSSNTVNTLWMDQHARLWIGTQGSGIDMLDTSADLSSPHFMRFGMENGLPSKVIDKIMEDDEGNIWASTDAGLARIDGRTYSIQALEKSEGADANGYAINAGERLPSGDLLFGSGKGLTIVTPSQFRPWGYLPPVVVTSLMVGNRPISAAGFNGAGNRADKDVDKGAESRPEAVKVRPEDRSLSIEFAALDFSAPGSIRYTYLLEGYDNAWTEVDASKRNVQYSNLAPGNYRFQLRGSNRNGVWTANGVEIPVVVLPAWYQTWWARASAVIALLAAMFWVILVRTRFLQRRKRELELLVVERTSELRHNQDELLGKNDELHRLNRKQQEHQSELTRFLAVASHDLRQPMHALTLYLGAMNGLPLPEEARDILNNTRRCAHTMDEMFTALLDLSRLDAKVVKPRAEPFPIATILASLAIEFSPLASEKGLVLRIARARWWVCADQNIVRQILANLVANAVRYTNSGRILIGCRHIGSSLRISVLDTGIGIPADQQQIVFEEFQQLGRERKDSTKGLGLGLAIVKRLATLIEAPITLKSEQGRGSQFAIDIPLATKPAEATVAPGGAEERRDVALDGRLVVVIDDDPNINDAMRTLLLGWGCMVETARSGNEMLAKLALASRIPDLIICDYQLGADQNGVDVIVSLRDEFNNAINAIIITGTVNAELIRETTDLEILTLNKPLDPETLRKALQRLLGG